MSATLEDYQADRRGRATLDDLWNCYRLYLGREPDPGGFAAYAAVVERGIGIDELTRWFASCPEYALRMAAQPSPNIARASLEDFDLYVPRSDAVVGEEILSLGEYEPHVTGPLEAALRPGMTVVDIGANIGWYSLLASRRVGGEGRVIAIEPLARNVKLLFANKTANQADNIEIHPYGVGDREGLITLLSTGSIASSRETQLDDVLTTNGFEIGYARTLDQILAGRSAELIKIDVDGFDHKAMVGARETLSRYHPEVFCEFAPGHLETFSGVAPEAYLRLFRDHGYDDFTVLVRGREPQNVGDDIERILPMPGALGATHVDLHIRRR
ncbi:MAG TPA: FkbM family methyltransferase [Caulobacteraceae bacterium]|jgi:FkbM family methyltransferase|nr:FkbM family methyltransferase [Caulobacteraceae bacterium]